MALDFGGNALFQRNGLEQDTGRLPDRWGQDGSTIKNFEVSLAADATVYTVPTGKRLFINSIYSYATSGSGITLKDGGAGGTQKFYTVVANNSSISPTLTTPIYFDTSLYADFDTGTGYVTMTGWLENLR